jgi:hypothetical protein
VFPNGQICRSFDQFAMGCQQNWGTALHLLKQGFFSSFFGDLGRLDLTDAARQAAAFPDIERGLDLLLQKIPSRVLEVPRLQVEPSKINLGRLTVGLDRAVEFRLVNRGMRLLYGSIASNVKWLTFGETPGQPEKVFQFCEESIVSVHVRGQHLRASFQPLEAQLVIDSNGGMTTVEVRANVPVTPFRDGMFQGALTPRQIAEKAKSDPKEAAQYIEDGRIAAWFQANGWTYPVQGPAMPGLGAVQQFFEALGATKGPPIHVTPAALQFSGVPDTRFDVHLVLSTPERKVVYGWGSSDRYWVTVGKTKLAGSTATIPLTINVPDCQGTHEAKVTVTGNGQQRFTVPVIVAVVGGSDILVGELIDEPPLTAPAGWASTPSTPQPAPLLGEERASLEVVASRRSSRDPPLQAEAALPPVSRRSSDGDFDRPRRRLRHRDESSLSLISMIVGIVSAGLGLFAICCWVILAPLAGMGGCAAVILGFWGRTRGAEGQAIAGIILGFAAIVLGLLWMTCGMFGLFADFGAFRAR